MKERMITRTIKAINYEVLCMDITTCETTIETYPITGVKLSNEKALSYLRKSYETDEFKLVAISDIIETEEMYGLSEIEFLKYAVKLDPATRKELTAEANVIE